MPLRTTACIALVACAGDPLAWPVPRIETAPAALALPSAVVGETNYVALEVVNLGTHGVLLTASVDLPFRVAADRLDVPAGATRVLQLSWTPEDYADADAVLRLTGALTDVSVAVTGAVDPDGDGDGDPAVAAGGGDCDDRDPAVRSGAAEVCDDVDNDCSGTIDDDPIDAADWFPDADRDGWGVLSDSVSACDAPAGSWSTRGGDCDDGDGAVNPGAPEIWYDGVDADCSGGSDHDRDGDGYDNLGTGGDDCRDENAAVNPGETEVPSNGVDDDCDGVTDAPG